MLTTRLHLVLSLRLSGAKPFLPIRLRSGDRGKLQLDNCGKKESIA